MTIPAVSTTEVLVKYYLPSVESQENLELLVQKQPGVVSYPVRVSVSGFNNTTDVIGGVRSTIKEFKLENDYLTDILLE
ncbi:hypothetical protein HYT02_06155 [Candidatus Gottesmanbacteria bacterium]|nr:hypothetical protein [Candidatus Gottesmanbacteria bacterium]